MCKLDLSIFSKPRETECFLNGTYNKTNIVKFEFIKIIKINY